MAKKKLPSSEEVIEYLESRIKRHTGNMSFLLDHKKDNDAFEVELFLYECNLILAWVKGEHDGGVEDGNKGKAQT